MATTLDALSSATPFMGVDKPRCIRREGRDFEATDINLIAAVADEHRSVQLKLCSRSLEGISICLCGLEAVSTSYLPATIPTMLSPGIVVHCLEP